MFIKQVTELLRTIFSLWCNSFLDELHTDARADPRYCSKGWAACGDLGSQAPHKGLATGTALPEATWHFHEDWSEMQTSKATPSVLTQGLTHWHWASGQGWSLRQTPQRMLAPLGTPATPGWKYLSGEWGVNTWHLWTFAQPCREEPRL